MNKYAELLRNAVESIEIVCNYKGNGLRNWREVLESQARRLSAAAAEMEQAKPVAWMWNDEGCRAVTLNPDEADGMWTPLYPAPVAPAVPVGWLRIASEVSNEYAALMDQMISINPNTGYGKTKPAVARQAAAMLSASPGPAMKEEG